MKIIHIAFFAVLALSLIGCSSGSSGAAPSSGGGNSDTVTIGGIDFDKTIVFTNVAMTSNLTYWYAGSEDYDGITLTLNYDDNGDTVNGVPCITQIANFIGGAGITTYYLAEAKNGNIYTLKEDTTVFSDPQLEFIDDLSVSGVEWDSVNGISGETITYEVIAVNEYRPVSGVTSSVSIEGWGNGITGYFTTYYDANGIPDEIDVINLDGVYGNFTYYVPTIIAPAGEG